MPDSVLFSADICVDFFLFSHLKWPFYVNWLFVWEKFLFSFYLASQHLSRRMEFHGIERKILVSNYRLTRTFEHQGLIYRKSYAIKFGHMTTAFQMSPNELLTIDAYFNGAFTCMKTKIHLVWQQHGRKIRSFLISLTLSTFVYFHDMFYRFICCFCITFIHTQIYLCNNDCIDQTSNINWRWKWIFFCLCYQSEIKTFWGKNGAHMIFAIIFGSQKTFAPSICMLSYQNE